MPNEKEFNSRANDKTVLSSHNLIPNGRQPEQEDVDSFVKKLKDEKKKK